MVKSIVLSMVGIFSSWAMAQQWEIVHDKVVDQRLGALVQSSPEWDKQLSDFEWLIVRNLKAQQAKAVSDQALEIPITFDIRYMQGTVKQGTLLVNGTLSVQTNNQGQVSVTVTEIKDSQWLEQQSRNVGILSEFDKKFASAVARPVLEDAFKDSKYLTQILGEAGYVPSNLPVLTKP